MTAYCPTCCCYNAMTFIREYLDDRGRKWEVWRCACGAVREWCVT